MFQEIFSLNRKLDLSITKEIRDDWRDKIQAFLLVAVEQCKQIQGECDKALRQLTVSIDDDGEGWYDDLETAQEIGRDRDHAMNLQAAMESHLLCIGDLFSGSTSGHCPFPDEN